jgi:glycosyltransferase involved in cell wall biosynthesis
LESGACSRFPADTDKRMRILHVIKTSEGAFWAVRQVAELVRNGVDVHVALPEQSGAAISAWQKTGATLHFVCCGFPINNLTALPERIAAVRRLVHEVRPDLIHSHFVSTTLMLRWALGRNHDIPRVFQVPGPLHLEHWNSRWTEISSAGKNDYWIASSQSIMRLYEHANIPPAKRFMSYYSADTDLFSTHRENYLRDRLNIPRKAVVVGNINLIYPPKWYLGQTVGLKCHEDVIEAISQVQRVRDDVWGVLIGGTFGKSRAYEEKLRRFARDKGAGKILMPGKFNAAEVGLSWPDFDCAVHIPLSENCGGVVEPLLSGVPTIAGEVGGLPEVVHTGRTGNVVPIRRPDLLAKAVLDVLDNYDEYKRMANLGRELVSVMFDAERCADEVSSIYRHILFGEARPLEFEPQHFTREREVLVH